ncbi:unnamed protein product [Zymoseptoria tritici ST99CH_3D1]|nr:unnamed protein product [Zymoseptoria tritici ST99CH_3D1]
MSGKNRVNIKAKEASLDVYAAPYVPNVLKQINEASAQIVPCAPSPWIDYTRYVQSFSGNIFLSAPAYPDALSAELPFPKPFDGKLEISTYMDYFSAVITTEVHALQKECEEYNMYQVPLAAAHGDPRQSMYWLNIPGLREASLRIEIGDIVQVRQLGFEHMRHAGALVTAGYPVPPNNQFQQQHNAVVWGIDRVREMVTLRIDYLVPISLLFNARFVVQSHRIHAWHRAVARTQRAMTEANQQSLKNDNEWMRSMLFPDTKDGVLQRSLNKARDQLSLFDTLLNYEQVRATETILKGQYGRVPYLISGPPGTGKTKTVVEIASQLVSENESSRLLLCAPSDSAADTLVQRLSQHYSPKEVLRLNSPARSFPEVPNSVLPFCHVDDTIFSLPPFPTLMRKRIVVTTCRDAEMLHQARLSNQNLYSLERSIYNVLHPEDTQIEPRLHFTALIIDEAAQAIEPEVLIPILVVAPPADLCPSETNLPAVIMVGDQHQLGPRTASKGQLQRSLFERLLNRPLYKDHPLARSSQSGGIVQRLSKAMLPIIRPPFTDLIRNYRSHPAIIATPSSLFYNDTLEPTASHVDSLLSWTGFEGRQMPVMFAENRTPDEIERDGGGWYNLGEVTLAIDFAKSFLSEGLVKQREICIMSPFAAQVRALRLRARRPDLKLSAINIGPLEAFQGLESKLVILCTTRTRDRFIDQDLAKGLGVIHEARRFNVALTRAKEGLIVIGHPGILCQDENWASFMAFCRRNGAWSGTGPEDWHTPHSRKIKMSRLEKQIQFRNKVSEDSNGDDGLAKRMRRLGLMKSEEDEHWEAGIAAEEALAGEEDLDAADDGTAEEDDAAGESGTADQDDTAADDSATSPEPAEGVRLLAKRCISEELKVEPGHP